MAESIVVEPGEQNSLFKRSLRLASFAATVSCVKERLAIDQDAIRMTLVGDRELLAQWLTMSFFKDTGITRDNEAV